jgi:hypothetical protein
MKEPIFAYEPVDLTVFRTVIDAELYLEPPEIRNNSLLFFDAEGRILRARVRRLNGVDEIAITDEDEGGDPSFLRQLLLDFLEHLGHDRVGLDEKELHDLVQQSLLYVTR